MQSKMVIGVVKLILKNRERQEKSEKADTEFVEQRITERERERIC